MHALLQPAEVESAIRIEGDDLTVEHGAGLAEAT
jgi:hypothetical protein